LNVGELEDAKKQLSTGEQKGRNLLSLFL
ncbi:hypothetical protein EVA_02127, partial [gut metagenome]